MKNGKKALMNTMKKIKRCGYTPYGYKAYINNQTMEFATENELEEYISGDNYEETETIRICRNGGI